MKKTRKYISVCLCVVMFASMCLCVGCQKKAETIEKKKKQIELWHYWDIPGNQQHLEKLVDQFNQSQDEIEVKVSYIPDEDFKKQLALSMADSEKALAPCSVNGRIYGQPFGVNCTAMFYNKKILEKAGCKVPENWEEFKEVAEKVSDKTIKGFAITALQTEESMYEFLPILWSMGGDIHSINTATGQQAFLFLKEMEQEGSLSLQSISLTMGDLTNQFIKGKIAMMFNSSMAIDSIREGNPDLEFGVAAIPCGNPQVTVAGGEILAVADNENKEYAIQFLKFLADKKRMKEYIDEFGFLAPRQEIMQQQFENDKEKGTFIDLYQNARTREISGNWPQISLTLSDTLREILVNENDSQTILDKSAEKIESIGAENR